MILDAKKIGVEWESFSFSLQDINLKRLMHDKIVQDINLTCLVKIKREHDRFDFIGEVAGHYNRACQSCLALIKKEHNHNFTIKLLPENDQEFKGTNKKLDLQDCDVDMYQKNQLPADKYIEDYLILELPDSFRCSDNCLGLCQTCGADLNKGNCQCLK
ncbi:MAG: DUF177 domain-containing protein [SAR324 cluster bacterium]|nr:DUF177 domain-containing protein [SAR324 cluster bacterium]